MFKLNLLKLALMAALIAGAPVPALADGGSAEAAPAAPSSEEADIQKRIDETQRRIDETPKQLDAALADYDRAVQKALNANRRLQEAVEVARVETKDHLHKELDQVLTGPVHYGSLSSGLGAMTDRKGEQTQFILQGGSATVGVDFGAGYILSSDLLGQVEAKKIVENKAYSDHNLRLELGSGGVGVAGSFRTGYMPSGHMRPWYVQVHGIDLKGSGKTKTVTRNSGLRPHLAIEVANVDFQASGAKGRNDFISWHPELSAGVNVGVFPCGGIAAVHGGGSLDAGLEDENWHAAYGANLILACSRFHVTGDVTRIRTAKPTDIAHIDGRITLSDGLGIGIRAEAVRESSAGKALPFSSGSSSDDIRVMATAQKAW